MKKNNKEVIKDFEYMRNIAEARAYQKLSLERPLTQTEFKAYNEVMNKIRGVCE